MIKRIIALCLTLSILCMGATYAAAPKSSGAEEVYSRATNLLFELGIVEPDALGSFSPDICVTRGEFCGIAGRIFKIRPQSTVVGYFRDVKADTENAGVIEAFFRMNVISRADDSMFYPNRYITMDEAIKLVLAASGYQEMSITRGGIYTGYYKIAHRLDLLAGIEYDGSREITQGEIAQLLYNLLHTELYEISSITVGADGEIMLNKSTGETVLSRYFNIEYMEAVVTANAYTGLSAQENVGNGRVRLDNMVLRDGGTNIGKYLGYRVDTYYDMDTETIRYYELSAYNSVLDIGAAAYPQYSAGRLTYEAENGRMVNKTIPATASIIYNNQAIDSFKGEYFSINSGNILLIDSDGNGSYETVIINNYRRVIANSFNIEKQIISTKDNQSISLADREYEIYDENGNRIEESYVSEWDVLSIAEPDGEGIMLIYRSRTHLQGTIASIGKDRITLDNGDTYVITADFIQNSPNLAAGSHGVLYLDVFGKPAVFRASASNCGLGYVVQWKSEGSFENNLLIQLLTYDEFDADHMLFAVPVADRLTVDGMRMTEATFENYLVSMKNDGDAMIIQYELNDKGELSFVDTIRNGDEDPEQALYVDHNATAAEARSLVYQPNSGIFMGVAALNTSTIMFYVPETAGSIEEYGATPLNLSNKVGYDPFTTYKIGTGTLVASAIVFHTSYIQSGGNYETYIHPSYIDEVYQVWNEQEGTVEPLITANKDGVATDYAVWKNFDASDLHKGDIVLLSTNNQGRINDYLRLYNSETKWLENAVDGENYNNAGYNAVHRTVIGYVYSMGDGIVALSKDNPKVLEEKARASLSSLYGADIPLAVLRSEILKSCVKYKLPARIRKYDTDEGGWLNAGTGDILPYDLYGELCSRLFIFSTYSAVTDAAIVE